MGYDSPNFDTSFDDSFSIMFYAGHHGFNQRATRVLWLHWKRE